MGIGADMIGEDETDMFLNNSKHRFDQSQAQKQQRKIFIKKCSSLYQGELLSFPLRENPFFAKVWF